MNYATSGGTGLFHWLFTLHGVLSIIIFVGMLYLIVSFIQRNKNDKKNNEPNNTYGGHNISSNTYDTDNEKSFWDDFNKKEDIPQRNEEPIPPNAIPPSPTYMQSTSEELAVMEDFSNMKDEKNLWEKDCSIDLKEEDIVALTNPSNQDESINTEEKGE